VTDQQIGSGNFGGSLRCAGQIDTLAPPGTSPVIDHAGGKFSGSLLKVEIVEADCASAGQKHDRRVAAARLMQQQSTALHLVIPPSRRCRVMGCGRAAYERLRLHQ
jgi:hypothetical protein